MYCRASGPTRNDAGFDVDESQLLPACDKRVDEKHLERFKKRKCSEDSSATLFSTAWRLACTRLTQ